MLDSMALELLGAWWAPDPWWTVRLMMGSWAPGGLLGSCYAEFLVGRILSYQLAPGLLNLWVLGAPGLLESCGFDGLLAGSCSPGGSLGSWLLAPGALMAPKALGELQASWWAPELWGFCRAIVGFLDSWYPGNLVGSSAPGLLHSHRLLRFWAPGGLLQPFWTLGTCCALGSRPPGLLQVFIDPDMLGFWWALVGLVGCRTPGSGCPGLLLSSWALDS